MRVTSDIAAFDEGRPLPAKGCQGIGLPGARFDVRGVPRPFVVDHLRLNSAAPSGFVLPGQGGTVLRQGKAGDGRRDNVRISVDGFSLQRRMPRRGVR